MFKYYPVFLVVSILICFMDNMAQNSDSRMWVLHNPDNTQFYEVPSGNLNFQNPNRDVMEYKFRREIVSVEPNFRVFPSNTAQSEVPIIRGIDPNTLFASANTFNTTTGFISEGIYMSTDGGNSWFGSDTCSSSPISNHGGDPGPGVGPDGRLYMSFLPHTYNSIRVTYSTDFGSTWSNSVALQTGSMDKNHTAVDNIFDSPYFGNVYVTWSDYEQASPPISVSYSTNGGVNWSNYQHINLPVSGHYSQGCNGAVGPGGVVYVTWATPTLNPPYTEDFIGFAKSTDGGVSWTYSNNVYDCNGIRGNLTFTGANAVRVNGFPWMSVDNSNGPRKGWIYIVTGERDLLPAGSDPDIVMHISSDGGETWSDGIRVNQDAINNGRYQYMPAIYVGNVGDINIIYYDTRNAELIGGIPDSAQVYISRSIDGGLTFEDILVSDHSFKPRPIGGLATGYQGDYIGITESNGIIYPYWCDNISGIYQAWTTRVFVEPPCGIAAASNPIPLSGTVNVDINLSQLSWENGSGDLTNELYFGTDSTALDLVQSGSLFASWAIDPSYLPLEYHTKYYWKVVEIGDTCSSSITFNFRTMQDPSIIIRSDTLYPQNVAYWTGSTDGNSKSDGEINTVFPNVGWAVYDISSITPQATITGVSFTGYVNATYNPYWSATPMENINPISDNAPTIYNQIQNNSSQTIAYIFSNESSTFSTGYHSYLMQNNSEADLQSAVTSAQGWFAMGFIERDGVPTYYINLDGWSQPHPPYIIVDYWYIVPVELTSFTGTVSGGKVVLNWSTATETNNQGFEIERSYDKVKYTKIGFVQGNGTTTEPKSYSFSDKPEVSSSYYYRLKQVDFNGSYECSDAVEVKYNQPTEYSLLQNYPNPFNPTTSIQFSIPEDGYVKLNIYNVLGQKVAELVNQKLEAGRHQVNFDAKQLSSGIYYYRLEADGFASTKKMMLLR